jgi:hypothetical protein
MKPIKEKIVSENSTAGAVVSEIIWIVGTVAVSYVAIAATRQAWKMGKALTSVAVSKVKS